MKKRSLRSQAITIRMQTTRQPDTARLGRIWLRLQVGLLRLIACSAHLTGLTLWFYRWRTRR